MNPDRSQTKKAALHSESKSKARKAIVRGVVMEAEEAGKEKMGVGMCRGALQRTAATVATAAWVL